MAENETSPRALDPRLVAIVALRALSQLYRLQGNHTTSEALRLAAAGIESGRDIDAHMREVAQRLEQGESASWDDIHARLQAEIDELRARGS